MTVVIIFFFFFCCPLAAYRSAADDCVSLWPRNQLQRDKNQIEELIATLERH